MALKAMALVATDASTQLKAEARLRLIVAAGIQLPDQTFEIHVSKGILYNGMSVPSSASFTPHRFVALARLSH